MLLKIEFLETNKTSINQITQLCILINMAYQQGEKGLWTIDYERITTEDLIKLIKNNQIVVAKLEDQIVGCIQLKLEHSNKKATFGMLSVDKEFEGKGIGGSLIKFIEKYCKDCQMENLQLELLLPVDRTHWFKERLKEWYTKLGFIPEKTVPFQELFSHLQNNLTCECEFLVWNKKL